MRSRQPTIWVKSSEFDYEPTGGSYANDFELAAAVAARRRLTTGLAHIAVETESGRFMKAEDFLNQWEREETTHR